MSLAAATLAIACGPVHAGEAEDDADRALETKNIFGFVSGTDIGPAQDREFEFESNLGFGKRRGRHVFGTQAATLEVNPTDWLEVDAGIVGSFNSISGVPGLEDRAGANFGGAEMRFSFVLVHRRPSTPVGVTISIEPEWSRVDENGRLGAAFSAETRFIADTELIPERLYAAANLIFTPEFSRDPDSFASERSSVLGASTALAYSLEPRFTLGAKQIVFGANLEYLRAYDKLAASDFAGDALFLGPTFYVHFTDTLFLAAAAAAQVAGRQAGAPARLDLADFPRAKAKMTIGVEF